MTNTRIESTDKTWNPVTGCDKVSPGCAHCYAETMAKRTFGTLYPPVVEQVHSSLPQMLSRPREFTDVQTHADRLDVPLRWRKPCRVFVNSMSDLFHEAVPDAFIDQVFAVMALCPQHTFQVLTKRPERMRDYGAACSRLSHLMVAMSGTVLADGYLPAQPMIPPGWPLPNVWLGVSVENQHFADERIPLLLQTPAAVRFVSAEPLIGSINLASYISWNGMAWHDGGYTESLSWVIVGGESGPKARSCDVAWIRSIVRQCQQAGVACFVKQVGALPWDSERLGPNGEVETHWRLHDHKGGDLTEWPEDLRVREWPAR